MHIEDIQDQVEMALMRMLQDYRSGFPLFLAFAIVARAIVMGVARRTQRAGDRRGLQYPAERSGDDAGQVQGREFSVDPEKKIPAERRYALAVTSRTRYHPRKTDDRSATSWKTSDQQVF